MRLILDSKILADNYHAQKGHERILKVQRWRMLSKALSNKKLMALTKGEEETS